MNKPLEPTHIRVYGVVRPGVEPASVNVVPNLVKLGWKFAELPTEALIDTVQEVDDYLGAMEKWVKAAREVLKTRLPVPEIGQETVTPGVQYEAHYTKSVRTDVDRDKVKSYFGDKYPEYCKSMEILTLKIRPIQAHA